MGNDKFREYVEIVLRGLVDEPEKLSVTLTESEKNYIITVSLPSSNVGQIVGKGHRMLNSLQHIFWGATGALTNNVKGNLIEFVETDKPS